MTNNFFIKLKMTKKIFLPVLFFGVFFFSSCLDDIDLPEYKSAGATNMNELKVSSSFDWKTTKTIQISIVGLPTLPNTQASKSTLMIKGSNDVFYSGFHAADENLTLTVEIPVTENKIYFKFGSVEKTETIENNKVNFSLIPKITE